MLTLTTEVAALMQTLQQTRPSPALLFAAACQLAPADWARAALLAFRRPPSAATKAEVLRALAAEAILDRAKTALRCSEARSVEGAIQQGVRELVALAGDAGRPALSAACNDLAEHAAQKSRRAA